mgnify:CR=1 FL=1
MRAKCAYYWQKMRLTYLSHFITRQRYSTVDAVYIQQQMQYIFIFRNMSLITPDKAALLNFIGANLCSISVLYAIRYPSVCRILGKSGNFTYLCGTIHQTYIQTNENIPDLSFRFRLYIGRFVERHRDVLPQRARTPSSYRHQR